MTDFTYLIHYFSIGFSTVTTALAASISQAKFCQVTISSINRQPAIKSELSRSSLLGLAIIETSALLGFICSILLTFNNPTNIYQAIAELGYSFAISIPGFIIAIASAMPAQASLIAISRQLFISKKISNLMVLIQSLIQTPVAFGFIIALIILKNYLKNVSSLGQALAILASGLLIGIGTLGPGFGVGLFTKQACLSIGQNRHAYSKLLSFTIISQAIIETPVIFSVIVAFWLLKFSNTNIINPILGLGCIATAFVMGIGTLGPGLGSSKVASSAAQEITINTNAYTTISRTCLINQGIIDTSAIYAFIISMMIIFKLTNL